MPGEEKAKTDARLRWIRARVETNFTHVKPDKWEKAYEAEENTKAIKEFLNDKAIKVLVFMGDVVVATHSMARVGTMGQALMKKGKGLAFIRVSSDDDTNITESNIGDEVCTPGNTAA